MATLAARYYSVRPHAHACMFSCLGALKQQVLTEAPSCKPRSRLADHSSHEQHGSHRQHQDALPLWGCACPDEGDVSGLCRLASLLLPWYSASLSTHQILRTLAVIDIHLAMGKCRHENHSSFCAKQRLGWRREASSCLAWHMNVHLAVS